jgi:tetratricopeptide (TPR) repeat protein
MNDLFRASEVLYWAPTPETRNFGDYISDLFLEKVLVSPRIRASRYRFVGSIIDNDNIERDLQAVEDGGDIAYWGCGARDAIPIREDLRRRCRFHGVRGPLTRELLRLPDDTPLGDPGLLLPLIHSAPPPEARRGGSICAPHIFEPMSDEALLKSTGVDRIVRPEIAPSLAALDQLLDEIIGADFVLAGAMHAAIVAHAYGVPFAFYDGGHLDIPFKWRDFAASIGAPVAFIDNLKDGRAVWADLIEPKAKRLPLSPLLAACPWFVRPSFIARAAAYDAGVEIDARVLAQLEEAGFEAKSYGEAAEESERRREARLQAQFDAQAAREVELETSRRALQEALAQKTEELKQAERACGRWMADADQLAAEALAGGQGRTADLETELAVYKQDLRDLSDELSAFQAEVDQAGALSGDLQTELEIRRQEVRDLTSELRAFDGALSRLDAAAAELEVRRQDAIERGAELRLARAEARSIEAQWDAAERRRAELEASLTRVEADRADLGERLSDAAALNARLEAASAVAAQERRILDEAVSALEARHADLLRRLSDAEARGQDLAETLRAGQARDGEARYDDRVAQAGLARAAWPWTDAFDLALARLHARGRRWRAAERAYGRILARRPPRGAVLAQHGHALKELGELELAATAYARAMRLMGPDADTLGHLAFALRACGRADEADALAEARVYPPDLGGPPRRARRPLGAFSRIIPAVRATKAGVWTVAVERWAAAARAAPEAPDVWVQYGHALKESGEREAALGAYLRALRLDPDRADTHLQIGHALKLLDRWDEAAKAYARAFALAPADGRIRVELEALGRSRAERLELVLAAGQRPPEAENSLGASIERPLAKLAAKRRDWAGAARLYARLLASAPGDWKSWVQLGHALKEQGRLEEAEGAYLAAIARRPTEADPHLQLGHLFRLDGETALALAAYDRAFEREPSSAEAWRELQALREELQPAAPSPVEAAVEAPVEALAEPEAPPPEPAASARVTLAGREARLRRALRAAVAAKEDR